MEAEIINTGGDESERDADDAEPPGPYLVSPAAAFAELQHETIDLTEGDDEIPAETEPPLEPATAYAGWGTPWTPPPVHHPAGTPPPDSPKVLGHLENPYDRQGDYTLF